MSKQQKMHVQEKTKKLRFWIRLLTLLYCILILLGLVLLLLAILLLALTSRFTSLILLVPGLLVGLGVLLAWVEYRLHLRGHHLGDLADPEAVEKQ